MKLKKTLGSAIISMALAGAGAAHADSDCGSPKLQGRAVLPVETYAPGPVSGTFLPPGVVNGVSFPLPSQPVQGISALLPGRTQGEFLAMPDNGFGAKATSKDFLIRAYYITPDFKTKNGGSGAIGVGDFISFSDPDAKIGFPIVNEATTERLLTGGDIDPESLKRTPNGDYWMGDEFGPWLLHFDSTGKLLDAPFAVAGNQSPNNPFLVGAATVPNSRGYEGTGMSKNGKFLYPALEGPLVGETDATRRKIYEFSTVSKTFTGNSWNYRVANPAYMIADIYQLDGDKMVVIERDGGLGITANFRNVYVVDLSKLGTDGYLLKTLALDMTNIPDPHLVSLPAIHAGDIGLGNPFRVVCESIEAVMVMDDDRLALGCDNNFPNKGRNPGLADDNEIIVVKVPGLDD